MIMTTQLARTPLYDWHVGHGGRMVDFAGWSMPVQYTSITEEHLATRNAVGVFDVSHMGRLMFFGDSSSRFLDAVATRRVIDIRPDQVRYSLLCNEQGGILDDVLIYGTPPDDDLLLPMMMVVNASNRLKIIDWLQGQADLWLASHAGDAIRIDDDTPHTAMIAVQGPKAVDVLSPLFFCRDDSAMSLDLRTLRYYHGEGAFFDGYGVLVSRTGYTGEDGFEISCREELAADIWERIIAAAEEFGGMAAGLGARDTLRLEAAMPLYGHELSEEVNPIQAGLGFAVNLGDRDFIGREALKRAANNASQPVRVGLQLDGKRVPRQGCAVLQLDEQVGEVTSGTFSPTLERPIAMAYVRPAAQAPGTHLCVDIRGTHYPAMVVPLPFYQRGKSV